MKTLLILLVSLFTITYTSSLYAQVGAQTTPSPCAIGNGTPKNIIYKVNRKTVSTLKGNVKQGDTIDVTFTLAPNTKKTRFALVSYNATANTFSQTTAVNNQVYDYDMQEFEAGTHTLSVFVPKNYFEVDFVLGCIIWKFGPTSTKNYYQSSNLLNQANGGGNAPCSGCNEKVTICHVPKGNPENRHSITISVNAAQAHIGLHGGDYYGECKADSVNVMVDCENVVAESNTTIESITLLLTYFRLDQETGEPVPSTMDSLVLVIPIGAQTASLSTFDAAISAYFGTDTVCNADTCLYYFRDYKIYGAYVDLVNHTETANLNSSWTGSPITVNGVFYPNPDYEICDRLTDIALPVQLIRFDAKKIEPNVVKLEWSTASETNNEYFSIERSSDIENWKEVCRVQSSAPGGNSQHVHDYTCTDYNANEDGQNLVYYRPKQVDLNGTFEYHNTIRVRLQDATYSTEIQSVFPNPTTDRLNIRYNAAENGIFSIRLIGVDGKSILQSKFVSKPGVQTYDLDLMEDKLKPGLYVLEIQTEKELFRQKVYKQ